MSDSMKQGGRLSLSWSLVGLACISALRASETVSFRRDVAPILINNCLACHGPKKSEGGLRVDSFQRLTSVGDSGSPGISAGDLQRSEVFVRITSEHSGERMPAENDPLPAEQIELIRNWIEQGAPYDAEDPEADLSSIIPPPIHPAAPQQYPHTLPITALAFRPDGKQLIVGGYYELTVWDLDDGTLDRRIGNVGERTYSLAFHPSGNILAVGSGLPGRLGEVRLLDASSGEVAGVLVSTSDVVFDVVFNPTGDRLAVASADGVLRVFDVAHGTQQLAVTSHSDWIMSVAWNSDGTRIASASRDKTAKVFDAETGDLIVTYAGHEQPVKGVAFHPDGDEVYSSAADNMIHRWKIENSEKTADVARLDGEIYKLKVDGPFMFTSSADKSARQYDSKSHQPLRSYLGHQDWVLTIAYHNDANRLATGGFDGQVRIWDVENGKLMLSFLAAPGIKLP